MQHSLKPIVDFNVNTTINILIVCYNIYIITKLKTFKASKAQMSFQTYPSKRDELYITSLQAMSGIKFTLREIDVIACIANNRGTKKIASILSISPRTASTHMYNIMSKLQTNSRDYIIDFVQKAGKLSDMRLYYFNILTEAAFTKMLASIKKLLVNQKSGYSLEFNQSSEKEQSFTKQLTHYLSIANINLIDGKSIEKAPQFFISSADSQDKISKYKESNLVLVLDQFESKVNTDDTKYIDFTSEDNFYFSFSQLIEHMINAPSMQKVLIEFQEEYASIQEAWDGKISVTEIVSSPSIARSRQIPLVKIGILLCIIMLLAIVLGLLKDYKPTYPKDETYSSISSTWNIPRQTIVFVGREKLLEKLEETLLDRDEDKSHTLAISVCDGLGGSGKTQLALQYIYYTKYPYTMKIWFDGQNIEALNQSYENFATELGYHKESEPSLTAVAYVKKWLASHPGWIIVIDNADNYDDIEQFLPEKGGHVILTTRKRDWPENFKILHIDVMTEAEAIQTLNVVTKDHSASELSSKKKLAEMLGYLPLALAQAGAYINHKNVSVAEYIKLYHTNKLQLLSDNSFTKGIKTTPVSVTWNISLKAILKEAAAEHNNLPIAIELITVCSYLAPDKISRNLLLSWLKDTHPNLSNPELILNKHIELLWKYSMINYDSDGNISIHNLVQTVLRYQLAQSLENKNATFPTLSLQWYNSLLRFFVKNESDFKLSNSFAQLLETREQFLSMFKNQYNDHIAELDLVIAPVYYYQERYKEGIELLDKVNMYLSTKPNREFLKSKILYLYSAYCRKSQNYALAQQKISESMEMFSKIKATDNFSKHKLRNLKSKILFNQANLIISQNKALPLDKRDIAEINHAITLTKEVTSLFSSNNDLRNILKSVELRGRLFVLLNNANQVIEEFLPYRDLLESLPDHRVKLFFYTTYCDAYLILQDFSKALKYCNLAESIATKLELKLELKNIQRKKSILIESMN